MRTLPGADKEGVEGMITPILTAMFIVLCCGWVLRGIWESEKNKKLLEHKKQQSKKYNWLV